MAGEKLRQTTASAQFVIQRLAPTDLLSVVQFDLLTDGQANHGITDPAVLVKHAAELTEEGITTTTLGYGDDFHEEILTALADAGRGTAYHVETADQAPAIFAAELEGLLGIAAQNVRLTVTPRIPGVEAEVLTDQRRHPGPTSLMVELDEMKQG